jgi:hypothetical protein
MSDETFIEPTTPISDAEKSIPEDPNAPAVGRWYYVRTKDKSHDEGHFRKKKTWLGCVVRLGSNYAKLEGVDCSRRVHFDEFDKICEPAPDAADVIARRISRHKTNVRALMGEIRDITAQLGVGMGSGILPEGETHAIAVRSNNADEDVKKYKTALVKAQDKTLPALFKRIEEQNKQLAKWMQAELIPLEAEAKGLEKSLDAIKQRIFSVELYAGLVEQIVEITPEDARAAPSGTPVHLMQRRCYMDDESLARYEAGGMSYKDVGGFYSWLARPENRDRLLPHPRCIVAFRIRRKDKANLTGSIFSIANEHKLNKSTFLFIRNGEKLFCLSTSIDFGERLFPHGEHSNFTGKLWLNTFWSRVDGVITDAQYQGLVEEKDAILASHAEYEKLPEKQRSKHPNHRHFWPFFRLDHDDDPDSYTPFEPSNIYYDDAVKYIQDKVNEHNRLVLVLQGLFDRSPVLHPHPPYKLWQPEGFAEAIRLVYDDSLALDPSETPPDFEAYRARLNASITVGTVTVGQLAAWHEDKEEERQRKYREYSYGPGPAYLDRVTKVTKTRKGEKMLLASFLWKRERARPLIVKKPVPGRPGWVYKDHSYPRIPVTFTCPASKLFNVDAYTPGDFRQFFDDPRTRANYIQWAPYLCAAEDYKAGKRKLQGDNEDDE